MINVSPDLIRSVHARMKKNRVGIDADISDETIINDEDFSLDVEEHSTREEDFRSDFNKMALESGSLDWE